MPTRYVWSSHAILKKPSLCLPTSAAGKQALRRLEDSDNHELETRTSGEVCSRVNVGISNGSRDPVGPFASLDDAATAAIDPPLEREPVISWDFSEKHLEATKERERERFFAPNVHVAGRGQP
ncbi:hypothetical protein ROHU_026901 [Labeo rohita]|uniref:Uncharacterized protein n=1 Tax=Labeo rohita TaxID=84645 RepID=A0A498M9E3_LABRO|nr:hypothetical protein ROHU_026901 [Labeo rohita]